VTHAHVGKAGIAHDAGYVCKVKIDEAGILDEIGNAGDSLMQHIIGDLKRISERDLLICGIFKTVVWNYKQRIDPAEQLLDAHICLIHAALALELERLCHDADREYSGLARNFRHDGSRTGAGAAAHTGSDKHHIRILNRLGDVVAALLRRALADVGIGSRALSAGHLFAYLNLLIGIGDSESLLISVDGDKLHALRPGFDHSVHNVIARAADADHLYRHNIFRSCFGFEIHTSASCVLSYHIK